MQALIPTCVSKQGHKNENTTNNGGGKTCRSIGHDVSQTFSCLHEIHPNELCQIIRPHQSSHAKAEEFFQNTSSKFMQIPSSLHLAVVKEQVIEFPPRASAKPPRSAPACSTTLERAVDTEAAAAFAAEDVHSIGHVAPYRCVAGALCGRRSARGQLTPAIGLAKVAQMF